MEIGFKPICTCSAERFDRPAFWLEIGRFRRLEYAW
jgi:hypothetical protein